MTHSACSGCSPKNGCACDSQWVWVQVCTCDSSECNSVGVLVTQSGCGSKCVRVTHSECSPNCWCACDSEWVWI